MPRWLTIADRAWFYGTFSNIRVGFSLANQLFACRRGRAIWIWGMGISLNCGCGGGECRFSAIRFRTAAHGECIWHVKGQHKVNVDLCGGI
jgi:hypothetical protein